MIIEEIKFRGHIFTGYVVELPAAPLVLVKAKNGFIMCGYLDINTANKLNQAACVVRGVGSIEEMLKKEVSEISSLAVKYKIKKGMTGREALLKLD
jgi:uncharacterized protein YunC (DUF1805 family)